MITLNMAQGTEEWLEARSGIITASAMNHVLAKGEGKTRRKYMYQMIGELITGNPAESYSNAHMERGHVQEPVARALYIEESNVTDPTEVGMFIEKWDWGRIGYSPDLVCSDVGLAEIKTRQAYLQAELLDTGKRPPDVNKQLQTGLLVTGRRWIDYVSYCPGMPLFVERVYPDLEMHALILAESQRFYEELDQKIAKLAKIAQRDAA